MSSHYLTSLCSIGLEGKEINFEAAVVFQLMRDISFPEPALHLRFDARSARTKEVRALTKPMKQSDVAELEHAACQRPN